jgi:DnaJ-class molecular chaperone
MQPLTSRFFSVFRVIFPLSCLRILCYSKTHPKNQKIQFISRVDGKGEVTMRTEQEQCPYCKGQGYFQLLLGGTENCPGCDGTGTHSEPMTAASPVKA